MRNVIAELVAIIGMDTKDFTKGLSQSEEKLQAFGKGLGKVGKMATMGFTLPVVAAGTAATKMAMDFETQMTNVFTLMDEGTIHSRDWKQEVLDLSKKVPQSTDVLSKGLYDIISAGIDAGSAIDVLAVASKSATAGVSDTATAVTAITSVLNAYGMEADQATDVSDILFTTIKYGVTTFPELSDAIGKVLSVAAAANVSFEEVGAALATMTKAGIDTNQATTALTGIISSFIRPTTEAKEVAAAIGFELSAVTLSTEGLQGALQLMMDKIGLTVDSLMEMEGAGKTEEEIMNNVATSIGLNIDQFATLIPNVRALKGMLALASQDGAVFNDMMTHMQDRTGATEVAFNKMAQTAQFEFDLAMSSVKATMIEIGQIILPVAADIFREIGKLADKFGELSPEMQKTIVVGTGIAAVIPVLLWMTSAVIGMIPKIKALTTAMHTLSTATKGVLGPIGLAVAAYAALGFGIDKLGDKIENDLGRRLLKGSNMISATKQAVNDWNRATALADILNQSMAKTVFMSRKEFEALEGVLTKIGDEYPELTKEVLDLKEAEENGQITAEEYYKGLEKISQQYDDMTKESRELEEQEATRQKQIEEMSTKLAAYSLANEELQGVLGELESIYSSGVINGDAYIRAMQHIIDTQGSYEGSAIDLLEQLGLMPKEYAEAQRAMEGFEDATEDGTEAIDEQKQSIDQTIESIKNLVEEIFSLTNSENSYEEAIWAREDAEKALAEAIAEHGAESREAAQAENELDRTRQTELTTLAELYNATGITVERQKELKNALFELLAQTQETSGLSIEEYLKMGTEFGLTTDEMIERAGEVGLNVDTAFKDAADSGIEDFIRLAEQWGFSGTEMMEKAEEVGIDIDKELKNASLMSMGYFLEMATSFGLQGEDIKKKAKELNINIDKELKDVCVTKGPVHFVEMAKQFGLSKDEIETLANEMGETIDEATRERIIEILLNDTEARSDLTEFEKYVKEITKPRTITISTVVQGAKDFIKDPTAAPGSTPYPGPRTGGFMTNVGNLHNFYSGGFITDNVHSVYPAMLHPNELVLNPQQQARLLFRLSNEASGGVGNKIENTFNVTSPKPLNEHELKMQIDLLTREFGYRMGM